MTVIPMSNTVVCQQLTSKNSMQLTLLELKEFLELRFLVVYNIQFKVKKNHGEFLLHTVPQNLDPFRKTSLLIGCCMEDVLDTVHDIGYHRTDYTVRFILFLFT